MKSPISRFTINGNSMFPTLKEGQDILSFNWAYLGKKPKVGDIVVIQISNREVVKRIQRIENNQVYVVGDNPNESTDSRTYGLVPQSQIIGKVIFASNEIPCPKCGFPVIEVYGRKDAICKNCGFKLSCCGEP